MLLSSSLDRCGFIIVLTWPMHPNILKNKTLGFLPYQASKAVRLFIGVRLG